MQCWLLYILLFENKYLRRINLWKNKTCVNYFWKSLFSLSFMLVFLQRTQCVLGERRPRKRCSLHRNYLLRQTLKSPSKHSQTLQFLKFWYKTTLSEILLLKVKLQYCHNVLIIAFVNLFSVFFKHCILLFTPRLKILQQPKQDLMFKNKFLKIMQMSNVFALCSILGTKIFQFLCRVFPAIFCGGRAEI